jgi:integrase
VIAFFNFCIEQGWIKDNPAKKIKKVPRQQEETLPFTREQYEALLEATHYYDTRGKQRNGETTNSDLSSVPPTAPRTISFIARSLSLLG